MHIHVERRGPAGARPLLFLNGSGATLETTRPLVDVLAARFDVLAHDQRGLGLTDAPPGPYTMADYASDALAVLDGAGTGWGSAAVFGISFGGMVAQELAVTAPDRVRRLALVCTSPGGAGGSSYPLHTLDGPPPRTLSDTRYTDEFLAEHPEHRGFAAVLDARTTSTPPTRGMREQLLARAGHDVWDRLPLVSCPTLVASGRYDGIAPLSNGEAIASRIPGAELRVYDGGHLFALQDRRALPEILDWLDAD